MNRNLAAFLVAEGARLAGDVIRMSLSPKKLYTKEETTKELEKFAAGLKTPETSPTIKTQYSLVTPDKPIVAKAGTGCRTCTADHLATCAGALAEALRFARSDGMSGSEVQERIALCAEELNIWERRDATPKSFVELSESDKDFLRRWLPKGRGLRHQLNAIQTIENLEKTAAHAQRLHLEVRKELQSFAVPQISLEEAKKLAAEEAAKEVESKWHSQEKK